MAHKMQPFWWFLRPTYPKKPYYPPAWNYDNLIGTIWLEDVNSAYDNSPSGQIEVKEPIGTDPNGETRGGTYDNRT